MGKKTKKNRRPERSICEQFAYTSHLVAYPNSSDMNELSEIPEASEKNLEIRK